MRLLDAALEFVQSLSMLDTLRLYEFLVESALRYAFEGLPRCLVELRSHSRAKLKPVDLIVVWRLLQKVLGLHEAIFLLIQVILGSCDFRDHFWAHRNVIDIRHLMWWHLRHEDAYVSVARLRDLLAFAHEFFKILCVRIWNFILVFSQGRKSSFVLIVLILLIYTALIAYGHHFIDG